MAQQVRGAAADVNNGTRSIEHFGRRASRLRQVALGRTFQAIGSTVRSLGRDLDGLVRRLRLVERGGKAAGAGLRKLGGLAGGALKNSIFGLGTAAVGAGVYSMFDLFRTAGQFEQYQVMLEGIEGSAAAARKSIKWVQEFTQKTPFELDQVMEAFVALKAYGIDPMNGSLVALGDTSAGMSKPIMQAVEALADATTGEFERLKEFGIRASKEGDRVVFSFRKNGKDIRREAKFTGSDIEKALVGIMNERFGGGMERQATTLFGIISNLKDMWTGFLLLIAQAGISDVVKKDLEGLLSRVNELAKSGELRKWAETISDRLQRAWKWGKDFVENTDWDQVAQDLRDIAEAVMAVADAVLWLKSVMPDGGFFSGERAVLGWIGSIPDKIKGLRGSMVPSSPGPAPGTPAARLPSDSDLMRRITGKQAATQIGGALKIDITSAPGVSARATPVPAPGLPYPFDVRTGRTMRSAS
ncbi:tape measure protein [Erythrobacter colymbi]|uniref:tape measure protein n=1 Tax=Erythrobacter colymbi TaxID=1161202 RepID=UPI00117ED3FD|nr:tape measure protein [Erythrobacter colymbi]